jgi:hypothetical protein
VVCGWLFTIHHQPNTALTQLFNNRNLDFAEWLELYQKLPLMQTAIFQGKRLIASSADIYSLHC